MKTAAILFFSIFLFSSQLITAQDSKPEVLNTAQVSQIDVSGKWVGKRSQLSWDRKSIIEEFVYEFDLKQEGDRVTGTTTIINTAGDYADMKIEGMIVGNKFHFAEKEVKSAIRPNGMVWCFKSGELNFAKVGSQIKLVGATPSFMENSNFPCSGGITELTKSDNSNIDLSKLANTTTGSVGTSAKIDITTFPNPFVEQANIRYNLIEDSQVKLEVFDISGKLVSRILDENQKTGVHSSVFTAKNYGFLSGIFIVKMTVNGEVFSRQLVQMR
ncbi:MAG: T9SS type A sorting domain-containing protein [Bacteroidetes bacterium]|nr:T9SS type A sorting domain-containing protein [Bacteroidota bacterium]